MPPAANPTAVSRTAAGDHEIAVPSLGLSLTQRRLLTLLDRPIPAASLAERSGLAPDKFVRDFGRLARFRLVDGVLPKDVAAGEDVPDTATRTAVTRPPVVTLRPAANAPSMVERNERHPGQGRWLIPATVFAAGVVAIALAWHDVTAGSDREQAIAPHQTPATPAAPPGPASATTSTPPPAPPASPENPTSNDRRPPSATASDSGPDTASAPRSDRADATSREATLRKPIPRDAPKPAAVKPASTPVPEPAAAAPSPPPRIPSATASSREAAVPTMPTPAMPTSAIPTRAMPTPATSFPTPPATVAPLRRAFEPTLPSDAVAKPVTPPHDAAAPKTVAGARPEALAPIARVAPDFPAEAIRRRIDSGRVRARVTIDAAGQVTAVAIVGASPRGVFDDAVTTALARWRFPAGATGRQAVVDIDFHRD